MLRYLVVAAALGLAGCVTPMTAEQQSPVVSYQAQGRTLVAVVDDRARVREGKPANFLGFARVYGVPVDWTVRTIIVGEDKDLTMSELLGERVALGLSANGGTAEAVALSADASDSEAEALLRQHGANNLLTLHVREWHFDVNTSWVNAFRFNSDFDVIVQRAGAGTVLRKTFTENQAIDAQADNSWGNMILAAYQSKLQQALNDSEVNTALTAPPPALQAETPAEDAAEAGASAPML